VCGAKKEFGLCGPGATYFGAASVLADPPMRTAGKKQIPTQEMQKEKVRIPARVKDLAVLDHEVRKMKQALARAEQCNSEGLARIDEIESRVAEVTARLDECPPADLGMMRPTLPPFWVFPPMDGMYRPDLIWSCDHYAQNADTASENCRRRVEYLNKILKSVAQNQADDFDRFISDIETFLEDYKECREGLKSGRGQSK